MRSVATWFLVLALAAPATAETPECRDAIARGIETSFNIAKVPLGVVRVTPEESHKLGELAELREKGAVTFMEMPKKKGDDSGERTFVVTPTKAALRHRDEVSSTPDAIGIRIRSCEVVSIAGEEAAGSSGEATVEDRKVITGVYRLHPTTAGEQLFKCGVSDDLRFRALVNVNSATGQCTVIAVDWGRTGKSTWETSNVH